VLPLIALASLVIVLMRPENVVFLMGPAILACLVVREWRKLRVLAAMAVGFALGCVEWIVGAYLWFGGPIQRLKYARQEPPPLHYYFALGTQLRYLNGSWYCGQTSGCVSWAHPLETPWWLAFLAIAILGLWAGWHRSAMKASSVLAGVTALWVFLLYAFFVPFGAPRYLLPTLALMAILVADGIVWAVTESRQEWRQPATVLACLFVLGGIVSQRLILQGEAADQTKGRPYQAQAAELEKLGVHPPCVIDNTSPAYYIGCSAQWTGMKSEQFLATRTPEGLNYWRRLRLPGPKPLEVFLPATSPVLKEHLHLSPKVVKLLQN
jgi:hypothetical protein